MVKYPYPIESAFDLITLLFIVTLLLLSILSLCYIFHLCFKSRTAYHLQHFNSLWTVRLLLVIFVIFWSFNELLRLPSFRRFYLYGPYPFLSSFFKVDGYEEEDQFCKVHVVVSLGFFQPAFLGTLLFLVDVSIKKKTPNVSWAIIFVLSTCVPLLIVQTFFLFTPLDKMFLPLPSVFTRSSLVKDDAFGKKVAFCKYPLLSTVIFGVFAVTYFMWFLFSLWKVLSLVINKGLRMRIYTLAVTVLVPLPMQVILLGVSVLWNPDKPAFGAISFVVFLSTFVSFAMGQGILVIKPIADSLATGGASCRWNPHGEEVDGKKSEGKDEKESVV
uniref:uncharacterized protein LOC105353319 n=1 Tax=Fragaria vesca subsp. vesca TaxID=101020 RepID=UPI0005C9CDBC|nr:PREDICTED: uncharacterized protein LOC105353319 [Fragaria vesca subsp. vesca]